MLRAERHPYWTPTKSTKLIGGCPICYPAIPYSFKDYLTLIDCSGRLIREDKHGSIDAELPPILHRLGIRADAWEALIVTGGKLFGRAMGRLDAMRLHAATLGQEWIRGVRNAERVYAR